MENNTVQFLASLLDAGSQLTARESECHKIVLHILHDILAHRKRAPRWIPMKFPWCNNGTVKQSYRHCWTGTKGKVTTFLDKSSLWTKCGFAHTNQSWNASQMNESIPVLLVQSVPYTMCCEVDVDCGVWHWWGNSAPRCTSKVDDKRFLVLHVLEAPPSSSVQEKTTLGGTEHYHSSWQCKESHRCCCYRPLAALAMGDSGKSTVLNRYESMRLRSLRQSERTTARDPVEHQIWTYPCYRVVNSEHQQRWMRWWSMTPSKYFAKRW